MKKFSILILAALALICASSCHKGAVMQGSTPVRMDGETLAFSVSAKGIATRSHFADGASTTAGETASLVWDSDDAIGIIAVPFNEETGDYEFSLIADKDHVGIARYHEADGSGNAVFITEEKNKTWWAAEGYTDDDCLYGIFAYYPATEKVPFKLYANHLDVFSSDEGGILVDHVYSHEEFIPWKQDGINYNKYHTLYDVSHFPVRGEIDKTKLVSAAALKSSGQASPISLNSFTPINSMLAFNIKVADGYEGPTQIDSISVYTNVVLLFDGENSSESSYSGMWGKVSYYYHSDYLKYIGITGKGIAPVAFSKQCQDHLKKMWDEDGGSDEDFREYAKIMETGVASANPHAIPAMDGLMIGDLIADTGVSADFGGSPINVSTTPTGPYFLVTYPTYNMIFSEDSDGVDLVFRAYSGGEVILTARKNLPENGFQAGYRYNFTLTLGEGAQFNGADAGSYDIEDELEL